MSWIPQAAPRDACSHILPGSTPTPAYSYAFLIEDSVRRPISREGAQIRLTASARRGIVHPAIQPRGYLMAENPTDPILWLPQVEDHDYAAAGSYLSLLHAEDQVTRLLDRLKVAPIVHFKAKDIFRASQLSLLGLSNSHVAKDQRKIQKGQALSPLLLIRDEAAGKVVIADGYHRLCAVYGFDEDATIPCKIT